MRVLPNFPFILLVGVILVHLVSNIVWLKLNTAPLPWDPSSHTYIALDIHEKLKSLNFQEILSSSNYYPIGIHFIAALLLTIFGKSILLTQFVGTIFFVISMVFLYLYIDLLFKNKKLALLTTTIFSLSPLIFSQSRLLMLDIPLIAILIISLYFLEKSNNLSNRLFTLGFFMFVGFLLLTKWTGLVYLLFPLLLTLINIWRDKKISKVLINTILGVILVFIIAAPWYLTNFDSINYLAKINLIGEKGADPADLLSIENIFLYSKIFTSFQVYFFVAFTFFASLIFIALSKIPRKALIIGTIATSYFIFTFISNKDVRYTMPIIPFVALATSIFILKLEEKYPFGGKILKYSIVSLSIVYFLALTVRPAFLEGTRFTVTHVPFLEYVDLINLNNNLAQKYDRRDWSMNEIIKDLNTISKNSKKKVIVTSEYQNLNSSSLTTYLKLNGVKNIEIETPDNAFLDKNYSKYKFPNSRELENYLFSSDYVIVPLSYVGSEFLRNEEALHQIRTTVLADYLPCNKYHTFVALPKTYCFMGFDEHLQAKTDLSVNGEMLVGKKKKDIYGPAEVFCQWGCSFDSVFAPTTKVNFQLIKSYTLPVGDKILLFKTAMN